MTDKEPNTNISATAECVDDDDADVSPEAAKATGHENGHSVSVLFEFFKELEKSEEGANEAQALRDRIPKAIAEDTPDGLDIICPGGRTLLHVAAREGLTEAAERLVNVKAILDARDDTGCTPLSEACWGEHLDIVRLLLDKGANSTILDNDNWSPLHMAARYRCSDITQLLLEKRDWNLDFKEKLAGRTPLHAAARGGGGATVRHLRAKGARLDHRDNAGWTPIMTAVMSGEGDAISELLKRENDEDLQLETEDYEGRTPLLGAAENSFWDTVHVLVEAGAKCNTSKTSEITDAESTSDVASDNNTALHCAVRENNLPVVKFLLRHHADVNARDEEGQQPLHLASIASDHESREHDIPESDTNSQVGQETRASYLGARSAGYIDMVRYLLEQHADTLAETKNGKSAMELAFDCGHHDRVEAIFEVFAKADDKDTNTLLTWAAGKTGRHWIATSLFKRRFNTSSEFSAANISEPRSAIEWAAHAKMPKVLWLLIASSPQSSDTKKALDSAKVIIKKAKNQNEANNQTEDIIDNPPTGLICTESPSYGLPRYDARLSSSLRTYEATMVRFYKTQGQFGKLIKARTVEDTIYRQGPEKIMREVIEKFEEHSRGLGKRIVQRPAFSHSEPTFTWIHLPATNMVWMDHLVERIMKDENRHASHFNQAKSFFKDSWIEIPDKSSMSRIMRPRFVSRDTKVTGIRTRDAGKIPLTKSDEKGGPWEANAREIEEARDTKVEDYANTSSSVAAAAVYLPYFSYSFQYAKSVVEPSQSQTQMVKSLERSKEPMKEKDPAAIQADVEPKRKKKIDHHNSEEEKRFDYVNKIAQARVKYQKLLDEYSGKVIHGSSTLDESYYHFGMDDESSKDKDRRNRSQVATESWLRERAQRKEHEQKKQMQQGQQDSQGQKEEKREMQKPRDQEKSDQEHKLRNTDLYWPLIRVNQLWIWTINDRWLISASSHPIDDGENELLDGILGHLEKQGVAGGSNLQTGSAAEMSQLIVDYCVNSYDRKPKARDGERPEDCRLEDFPSIRQTFLKSLSFIERNEAYLFDTFSDLRRRLRNKSQNTTTENSEPTKFISLDDQLAEATSKAEKLSRSVRDILDELGMLQSTIQYQEDVQRTMRKRQMINDNGREDILETDIAATRNLNDIKRLTMIAERILATIDTTLSLHQSEIANLQAGLAMQDGRVLMVFTVVTILFLPMSFLTSLFALDVASFQQAPPWALGVIFSVSAGFFIPMVIFAFSWKRCKRFLRGLKRKLPDNAVFQPQRARTSGRTQDNDEDSDPDTRSSGAPVQAEHQGRARPSGLRRLKNMQLPKYTRSSDTLDVERGHNP